MSTVGVLSFEGRKRKGIKNQKTLKGSASVQLNASTVNCGWRISYSNLDTRVGNKLWISTRRIHEMNGGRDDFLPLVNVVHLLSRSLPTNLSRDKPLVRWQAGRAESIPLRGALILLWLYPKIINLFHHINIPLFVCCRPLLSRSCSMRRWRARSAIAPIILYPAYRYLGPKDLRARRSAGYY